MSSIYAFAYAAQTSAEATAEVAWEVQDILPHGTDNTESWLARQAV